MFPVSRAVLARAKKVSDLEDRIAISTGEAMKGGKDSKAFKELESVWKEFESEAPFTEEASDDIQVTMLKSRGRDMEAKQVALAKLTLEQGDFGGMRESILLDYENEMAATIRSLEALVS